jgi:hypothetical protein
MLRKGLSIDHDGPAFHAQPITWEPNNSFDVIGDDRFIVRPFITPRVVFVSWILKNNYVSTHDLALRQQRKTWTWRKDELVNEQVVTNGYRILHRTGRHLHSLNYESHAKEGHDHRNNGRLKILANNRLGRTLRLDLCWRCLTVTVTAKESRKR